MDTLTFSAKNAFGIGSMNHTFKFKEPSKSHCMAIYAPNGTCKSSIRRSLELWNEDKRPEDVFFPENSSSSEFDISASPETNGIAKGNVFCFQSMPELQDARFFDDDLLASPKLKARYLDVRRKHSDRVGALLTAIREEFAGSRTTCASDMRSHIRECTGESRLHDGLRFLLEHEAGFLAPAFMHDMKLTDLLKSSNETKLTKKGVSEHIAIYAEARSRVLSESGVFHDGFDINAATDLATSLQKAHFFEAGHSIVLNDRNSGADIRIKSAAELTELVKAELQKASTDPSVQEAFSTVDKAIGGAKESDALRDMICDTPGLAEAIADLPQLKLDYLTYAVGKHREGIEALLADADGYLKELGKINAEVQAERTDWDDAIEQFKNRFRVPFGLNVKDRASAIIDGNEPVIEFTYGEKPVDKDKLLRHLSDGERKALYMLSVIFEVERARKVHGNRLLVFDDVVDSFDYANKYAFIEYLKEFSEIEDVYVLLLTHNYDFFRTVTNRVEGFSRSNCSVAERDAQGRLTFDAVEYINKNPFQTWKGKMAKSDAIKIATIPMVREMVDIREGAKSEDYEKLSAVIHGVKGCTLSFSDLSDIYRTHWDCDVLDGDDELVKDAVARVCDEIARKSGRLKLEEKIVLSIGIRGIAESEMRRAMQNNGIAEPESPKFGKLVDCYKKQMPGDYAQHAATVEAVSLLTPENIHANSFMYEPLVDIGSHRFVELYRECKSWQAQRD